MLAQRMRNRLLDGAQRHKRPRCGGCCRWLVVGLALACVLVLIVQRMTLSVAVIPWSKECGWGVAQQQSILGAFFWGYLATMIPGALLGNRFTAHAAHAGCAPPAAIIHVRAIGCRAIAIAGRCKARELGRARSISHVRACGDRL